LGRFRIKNADSSHIIEPLKKFEALAGKDPMDKGILACRVEKSTPMPSRTLAIPWTEFPKWLKSKLKTQRLELRNHWRRGVLEKD
jgi:hypothetical protein